MGTKSAVQGLAELAADTARAVEAQSISRAAMVAMHQASGGQYVRADVFIGAHGVLLADAARLWMRHNAGTQEQALEAILGAARNSLAMNFGSFTKPDEG